MKSTLWKGFVEVKSGSDSAVVFGQVMKLMRNRLGRNQSEVASLLEPTLSVSAISMAEGGDRPLKLESMVRNYASALDLDDDDFVELWWACQGQVGVESWKGERIDWKWWRELRPSLEMEIAYHDSKLEAGKLWTPNENFYAPEQEQFCLAEVIGDILKRLLGNAWKVSYQHEIGLAEPVEGYWASVKIHLETRQQTGVDNESSYFKQAITCPAPRVRPEAPRDGKRPADQILPSDVAWILTSVEKMSVRERAAVAGFIHGLREAPSLFSDLSD